MIIFEGEELLLQYHEGKSDYILITFASADQTEHAYNHYFLKPIVEKYQLSCLGITTKIDNFYQHSDMHTIILICNEITKNYNKIIIIGLSMGGYAALKFSSQLHATIVFAMGARYTLDANIASVCEIMQRTVDRLDPYSIQETTIHPEDVSGKIYIAHDTYQGISGYNAIDHDHAYKLLQNLPNAVLVPVIFAHHLIVNSLKGSEAFKSILDVLVTEDDAKIIHQVAYIRRHHIQNIYNKISLLKDRYPLLCYQLLISQSFEKVKNHHILFDDHEKILTLIYLLKMREYHEESRALLEDCFLNEFLKCGFYKAHQMNKDFIENSNIEKFYLSYLIAYNGYILVFDQTKKQIIALRELIYDAYHLPVCLYKDQDGHNRLVCKGTDILFELSYYKAEIYLTPLYYQEQFGDVFVMEQREKSLILYTPDHHACLTVNQEGDVDFCTIEPQEWEQLAVV